MITMTPTDTAPITSEDFEIFVSGGHFHVAVRPSLLSNLPDGQKESFLDLVAAETHNFFAGKMSYWGEVASILASPPMRVSVATTTAPVMPKAMSVTVSQLAYILAEKAGALMRGDFKAFRGRSLHWSDAYDAYTTLYRQLERQLGAFMPVNIPDPDDLAEIGAARTEIVLPVAIKIPPCPSCDYTHFCAIDVGNLEGVISIVIECDSCQLNRSVTLDVSGVINE